MPSTLLNFTDPNNGGTNGTGPSYTCAIKTTWVNQVLVLFIASNVTGAGGALAPRSVLSVSDNSGLGLSWQLLEALNTESSPNGNGNWQACEIWYAKCPHIVPASTATVTLSPTISNGACAITSVAIVGVNINAFLDNSPVGPPRNEVFGVNQTTTRSQPILQNYDMANINGLGLQYYITDDSRDDFSHPSFASGTLILSNNQEPAVGQGRVRTGLQFGYQLGPGFTPFMQAGVLVGTWMAFGLLFTDGTTPPPIFRARSTIIQ